jgi:UDP-3-O-[3-hydroxymyristoyl] glucosamine N-acyltransferase
VLLHNADDAPLGMNVIEVADPDAALCQVLPLLAPPVPDVPVGIADSSIVAADAVVTDVRIGPHVTVGPGAVVGPGTQLHAGVYVGAGTRIGRDCVLWPNVVVRERITIGDRVVINANSTIGTDGFGYIFRDGRHLRIPQVGTVIIEDDVEVGSNVCIDRARSGATRVGNGSKIDNLVQIAHNVTIAPHCVIVAQTGISGSCTIGAYTVLAGQVGVADHVDIGSGAQIGAQAGVIGDIPDGARVVGMPARPQREYFRDVAVVTRVPEALRTLKALEKRVSELEAAAHDRA